MADSLLAPGAHHYRAYVGHADQYDFMGASQFRLLTALGLREHHRLLDFGCGSLRAGRLFIPYLLPGNYYGLEPERWLVEEGINSELGADILSIKQPTFRYASDFSASAFNATFDFALAQSVFSHAGPELIVSTLSDIRSCLSATGLLLATFVYPEQLEGGKNYKNEGGWVYPDCTAFSRPEIEIMARKAKLCCLPLDWFHPRQTWFAFTINKSALPVHLDDDISPAVKRQLQSPHPRLTTMRNLLARGVKVLLRPRSHQCGM